MAYSRFSLVEAKEQFGLQDDYADILGQFTPIFPSDWLQITLQKTAKLAYVSEKSRSEAIVMPILIELQELSKHEIAIYSGANLDADRKLKLNGECDFILSRTKQSTEIETPIFCLVEAKDDNIQKSLGQCVAQMVGARIFNQKHKRNIDVIWGCVTNGDNWQLLKLENALLSKHHNLLYINQLPQLLGGLFSIISQ